MPRDRALLRISIFSEKQWSHWEAMSSHPSGISLTMLKIHLVQEFSNTLFADRSVQVRVQRASRLPHWRQKPYVRKDRGLLHQLLDIPKKYAIMTTIYDHFQFEIEMDSVWTSRLGFRLFLLTSCAPPGPTTLPSDPIDEAFLETLEVRLGG